MTLARVRSQLLHSLKDRNYRAEFVRERVRSSVALQIRAIRDQREITQAQLGDLLGKAQAWVSRLENPEYGKLTVATLLELAEAFDTDLEIKFRPFSKLLDSLPRQGPAYFMVKGFESEFGEGRTSPQQVQEIATTVTMVSVSAAQDFLFQTVPVTTYTTRTVTVPIDADSDIVVLDYPSWAVQVKYVGVTTAVEVKKPIEERLPNAA